jgi:hypothetical protein
MKKRVNERKSRVTKETDDEKMSDVNYDIYAKRTFIFRIIVQGNLEGWWEWRDDAGCTNIWVAVRIMGWG